MARTKGNKDLYQLIHALTPEEKGYFKKFSGRHTSKDSQYLKIFDLICGQSEFDEAELKKRFKNYAVMKVYLFDMIIQSLMTYIKDSDVQTGILKKLISYYILQNKGLKRKANHTNLEALSLAEEHELFWLQEQCLRNKLAEDNKSWERAKWSKNYLEAFENLAKVRRAQDNRDQYVITINMLNDYQAGSILFGQEVPDINALARPDFLSDKTQAATKGNNRQRLYALGKYYNIIEDYEQSRKVNEELLEFEQKLIKEKHPLSNQTYYSFALQGLILASLMSKEYESLPALLDMLMKIKFSEQGRQQDKYRLFCLRTLDYLWRTGQHKKGLSFLETVKWNEVQSPSSQYAYLYMILILSRKVLFLFSAGQYSKAILTTCDLEEMGLKNNTPQIFKSNELIKLLIYLKSKDYPLAKQKAADLLKNPAYGKLSTWEAAIFKLCRKVDESSIKNVIKTSIEIIEKNETRMPIYECLEFGTALKHIQSKVTLEKVVQDFFRK